MQVKPESRYLPNPPRRVRDKHREAKQREAERYAKRLAYGFRLLSESH